MPNWRNSKMSVLFYSADDAWENIDCIVEINDENILVKYMEDGVQIQYKGTNFGDGHFELVAEQVNGRATLHRFPPRNDTHLGESGTLEGSWVEKGYRGMWRIRLGEPIENETAEALAT